jgi:hypothetical protein
MYKFIFSLPADSLLLFIGGFLLTPHRQAMNELFMKLKHVIILIVIAYCVDFFGSLQKVLHSPNADTILITGTILKISGWLLLLYKILTHPKAKEFLNW